MAEPLVISKLSFWPVISFSLPSVTILLIIIFRFDVNHTRLIHHVKINYLLAILIIICIFVICLTINTYRLCISNALSVITLISVSVKTP